MMGLSQLLVLLIVRNHSGQSRSYFAQLIREHLPKMSIEQVSVTLRRLRDSGFIKIASNLVWYLETDKNNKTIEGTLAYCKLALNSNL